MIKRMLLVGVCLFSLTTTAALADEEEYPPKEDDKDEVSAPDKEDKGEEAEKDAEGKGGGEDEMAETGSDTAPLAMAAGGLILVGGTLVASSRRREAEASPDRVTV
jgi:LPXTG-motif cell wall-anchored protein